MHESHLGTGMNDVRQSDGHHLMGMSNSSLGHLHEYMVRWTRLHLLDGEEGLTTERDSYRKERSDGSDM